MMRSTFEETNVALAIHLFGPPVILLSGVTLPPLRTRKGYWLLALLALRAGRPVERTWLAETLWPDSEESKALYSLRRCLNDLRQALGDEAGRITAPGPRSLSFDLRGAFCDVLLFDDALGRGGVEGWERATQLYRGPLLEGCAEEWVFPERAAREQKHLDALQQLAHHAITAGDLARAVPFLHRVIAAEPLREEAARMLMRALADQGNVTEATAFYRRLRRLLREQFQSAPAAETTAVFQSIRSPKPSRGDSHAVSPPETRLTHAGSLSSLPRPRTPLIGQEQALSEIESYLQYGALVTLVGTGGIGKTRLALEVAEESIPRYAGGTWFVDLSPLREDAQILPTIVRALGVESGTTGELADAVFARINGETKHCLMVLDNCEHLTTLAAWADRLLRSCPRLSLLATSRQALDVPGEVRYRVPSLPLPPTDDKGVPVPAPSPESLPQWEEKHPAVRLFMERARRYRSNFTLTPGNAVPVARICTRLGGIPLAIELAAARVATMSVESIAARLDDRFALLNGGSAVLPARQRTLRACLDWSYDLLTPSEQRILQRLSVFAGGWTLEAAEAVCADNFGGTGTPLPDVDSRDILDLLDGLVNKSLIFWDDGEEGTRYGMSETIRQYAADHMQETALPIHHLRYYTAYAEEAGGRLSGPEQEFGLQQLERERDNCWVALGRACADPALHPDALRMAGWLSRFWLIRGHWQQGRACLEALLANVSPVVEEVAAEQLARACNGAGALAWAQGKLREAYAHYARSLETWRRIGDSRGEAAVLGNRAMLALQWGDYADARQQEEQSLAIRQSLGDDEGVANSLSNLGLIAWYEKDFPVAKQRFLESLRLRRRREDPHGIATCLNNLGLVACDQEDYESARILYAESESLFRAVHDRKGMAETLHGLADIAYRQGRDSQALDLIQESLLLFRELGDRHGCVQILDLSGKLAQRQCDPARQVSTYQERAALCLEMGDAGGVRDSLENIACALRSAGQGDAADRLLKMIRDAAATPDADAAFALLEQGIILFGIERLSI